MLKFGAGKRAYTTNVVECLTQIGVVLNADISLEEVQSLIDRYRKMKARPPEVALLVGCVAAGDRAKAGDVRRAEKTLLFVESRCEALRTPLANAVLEQTKVVRKLIEETNARDFREYIQATADARNLTFNEACAVYTRLVREGDGMQPLPSDFLLACEKEGVSNR